MGKPKDKNKNYRIFIKENLIKIEEVLYSLIVIGLLIVFGVVIIDGFFVLFTIFESKNLTYTIIKFLDKVLVA